MTRKKIKDRALVKIGFSSSIEQFYLLRLEEFAKKSNGVLSFAAVVRMILKDFIEKGSELP